MTARIVGRLHSEFRFPDAVSPISVEALMLELFVASERTPNDSDRIPSWLREARSIVTRRFADSATLTAIASAVDVRPAQLARAFRRHYGLSVGDFIRQLRVEHAQRRLATKAPLGEIALDAGFADQSHLTRTFRRVTGMTPAAYRQMVRTF
jgi:AraC family transcriptional regulator